MNENQYEKGGQYTGPRGGHLRVTWQGCPSKVCPSSQFEYWDVNFEKEKFWCGTCLLKLKSPIFGPKKNGD